MSYSDRIIFESICITLYRVDPLTHISPCFSLKIFKISNSSRVGSTLRDPNNIPIRIWSTMCDPNNIRVGFKLTKIFFRWGYVWTLFGSGHIRVDPSPTLLPCQVIFLLQWPIFSYHSLLTFCMPHLSRSRRLPQLRQLLLQAPLNYHLLHHLVNHREYKGLASWRGDSKLEKERKEEEHNRFLLFY